MRRLLLLLPILLLSCYQVERNCTDFKTGVFQFNYTLDSEVKTGKFQRTEAYNIDYFDSNIDTASVRWINDCEFILTKLRPKNKTEEKAIHMKIMTTTDSSYTFEYNFVGESFKQKGVAYKTD